MNCSTALDSCDVQVEADQGSGPDPLLETSSDPGGSLVRDVRAWLTACSNDPGFAGDRSACAEAAEMDPTWLRVVRDGLGHEPFLLAARDAASQGAVCGCLPMALVASRLFGRFFVSLPYLNRAGVAARDAGIADALLRGAVALAEEHDVRYLELRHSLPIAHDALPHKMDTKVRMVLELPESAALLWEKLASKVRNQVRKGDRHALSIRWGGGELLRDFYRIFSVNMRNLGTPVYPRRLFASILENFSDRAELAVADHEGRAVAAALLVHGGGGLTQVPSACSLPTAAATCANMWMYHKLLVRAIERGGRRFDFGRSSSGSGTHSFKKQWGAQPAPTTWQYHLRRGSIDAMRPQSPRYRRWVAGWQKLPVWGTRVAGPAIVRGIP